MWICPQCGADVETKFEICWGCGTSRDGQPDPSFRPEREGIITEDAFEADRAEKTAEKLMTVGTFYTLPPVYELRDLLESHDIPVTIVGAHLSGGYGSLTIGGLGGIDVQVFESDAERVADLLTNQDARFDERDNEEEDE